MTCMLGGVDSTLIDFLSPVPVFVFPSLVIVTWMYSLVDLCMQRRGKPLLVLHRRAGEALSLRIAQCWHITVFLCSLNKNLSKKPWNCSAGQKSSYVSKYIPENVRWKKIQKALDFTTFQLTKVFPFQAELNMIASKISFWR